MNKTELLDLGQVFFGRGNCHAVVVKERVAGEGYQDKKPKDRINPIIEIWTEDDENWFLSHDFDASWLPDLIKAMQKASEAIIVEWPKHGPLNEVIK